MNYSDSEQKCKKTPTLKHNLLSQNLLMKKVSVSIDVRLIERKDRGYFQNYKMFNKKNDFLPLDIALIY